MTDTIRGRADWQHGLVRLDELHVAREEARRLEKIFIVACGTSYYAALVGKFLIEQLARIPVEVDYGSEFRYRDPILNSNTAVLAITQSGETVDTLSAMEEARDKGARLWSIVNAVGSQAHRLSDGFILMHAGPEIGVASTKAFTASLVDEYLLAVYLGQLRGTLDGARLKLLVDDLARLPDLMGQVLTNGYSRHAPSVYEELANLYQDREYFLYLGRGVNYPIMSRRRLRCSRQC